MSGNIYVGKNIMTEMLAKRFGWKPLCELLIDNPYFEDFNLDMKKWSFDFQ
ncbi:MAG: deoxynucleoside kinase [Candidatus Marinimicrobia bacterium]|nr:deoxynucleoside kinase [Candidatus Neomarinimicrobiota bacterium]